MKLAVRLGAWYGDEERFLDLPQSWEVTVFVPQTPAPLTDAQIQAAVENPVAGPTLRRAAAGKRRPIIIVDDLTRPTPTDRVIPYVLRELAAAGIPANEVRIILGSGTHGLPASDAVQKKAGREAAASCRLLFHDARARGDQLGRTRFGTPVIVDREVAASDMIIGVGGVYPQHSVGFGGGSKLVLGILARRSIVALHYGHPSVSGSYDTDNEFRRDLDEMARIVGMRTLFAVHIDAARRPVRIAGGDPELIFADAADFARRRYAAPTAVAGSDVVIANAYPIDVSLTFARSKGLLPLAMAPAGASRVLIAACPEGLGMHGLFPYLNGSRFEASVHRLRRLSVLRPSTIPRRLARKVGSRLRTQHRPAPAPLPEHRQQFAGQIQIAPNREVHLWAPLAPPGALPVDMPGLKRANDWNDVVARVTAEHLGQEALRVVVYPCSPIQVLDPLGEIMGAPAGRTVASA